MDRLTTITAAVIQVIDHYPVGHQFHGNQLKNDAVRLCPAARFAYVDSFLRMARRWRREAYRPVNRNKSLYERVPYKTILEVMEEKREEGRKGKK